MAQKIAAPAETLRRLARSTSLRIPDFKEKNQHHNAQDAYNAAVAAYDAAGEYSSNLVSIDAHHAATLCALAEDGEYRRGLSNMLRHQGYW